MDNRRIARALVSSARDEGDAVADVGLLDLDALWTTSLADLRGTVTGAAQRAWLDDTRAVGFSDDTVILAAPHGFAREQLDTRYGTALRDALTRAAGRDLTVVVTVRPDPEPEPEAEPAAPSTWRTGAEAAARAAGDRDRAALNDKYTFDRFVIGASNRFAHAAAFAVAEAPAKAYNPLFIYGGAGLGKTHLLQAVGHYALSLYGGLRVRYVTSEQFTNEFIEEVIGGKRGTAFQRRYRDVDVLLIDDIQFLEHKERTQEEFFHTFNALHTAAKQIVISSDRPPKQIGQLEDRLRTRFEWGLITDIQPPDVETRLAILRKKCAQEQLPVPADVLELIANRIQSNIRELEGALIRVTAFASLQRIEVDLALAQLILKDLFPDGGDSQISVSMIMSETASYFGLSLEELCSTSRTRQLVQARQIAMYLTRELTDLSLPKIGQAFGGRDHTTVMHANNKIRNHMKERPAIYSQVQELTSRVKTTARSAR